MTILEKCVNFENSFYTTMDKIHFLKSLPEGISVEPITKNLLTSAKKELEKLQKGVMAKISMINREIEAESIFVLLENIPQSLVAIDLTPNEAVSKFVINVFNTRTKETQPGFETYCSGNIENIRPGQVSGEHILLPEYITTNWNEGDILDITVVLEVNGVKVCSNIEQGTQFIYRKGSIDSGILAPQHRYGTSSCAFTEDNKGFGRSSDKDWLNTYIPTKGLSVVYGPSRVGKSSLLKYISNYLAVDYKHRKGAFALSNKKIDVLYVISHAENYHELPNAEKEILSFLFLDPIRATLRSIVKTDMLRSKDMDGNNISREAAEQILRLLDIPEEELSLKEKLETISDVLAINKAEIWVLIDEFQQVVEKWPITQSVLFKDLCKQLKESIDNIRYVICGADELVKLMINRDPVMVMYKDKTRAIGQFTERDKGDFIDMLCDEMVWGNAGHPFTQEALNYIFTYTGGNAMYGKLIGNRVIDAIEFGEFANRRKIYPYDVSAVVARMLSEQKSDIHATSAVNEFIANVTKNLETESPYLAYIASLMMKEPDRTRVPSSEIYEYFGALSSNERKTEIDTALLLCSVRGILNTNDENGESVYSFSTTFYFSQYSEIVKRNGVPNRVISEDNMGVEGYEELPPNDPLIVLRDSFKQVSKEEREQALHLLYGALSPEEKKEFRRSYGDYSETNIDTQNNNNILFNAPIQLINKAFASLFNSNSAVERLEAFKTLPRLDAFYTDQECERMKELQAARSAILDNDSEDVYELQESDAVVMDEIEEINTRAQNRYYGEMVSTMVKNSDEMPNSSVFAEPTDDELKNILGVKKSSQITLLKELPKKYYRQLCFAVALHKLILPEINEEVDYTDVDFSPISIMYCKLVEIMLKENHLELYGKALAEEKISSGESFRMLNEPDVLKNKWKDITIGTFVWHLIVQYVEITPDGVQNKSYFKSVSKNGRPPKHNKMPNIMSLCDYTGTDVDDWKEHAMALAEIVEIRNTSAHGGNAVSKAVFDHLLKVLFNDGEGELRRILELYQKKNKQSVMFL